MSENSGVTSLARRSCREQAVLLQKLQHEAIEQPGLLDLTGVAGAVQDLHLAVRDTILERKRGLVGAVLAAGQNDRRAGNTRMMVLGIRALMRVELVDDRLDVGVRIAFGE